MKEENVLTMIASSVMILKLFGALESQIWDVSLVENARYLKNLVGVNMDSTVDLGELLITYDSLLMTQNL